MARGRLVTQFMLEEGYTNSTETYHGVQKFRKGSNDNWDYYKPERMLKDYDNWLLKNGLRD